MMFYTSAINFPQLSPYTKSLRHAINYGSAYSSRSGPARFEGREKPSKRPNEHSDVKGYKSPSSASSKQRRNHSANDSIATDGKCSRHREIHEQYKNSLRKKTLSQHKRKGSIGRASGDEEEHNYSASKTRIKTYVPITTPKYALVPEANMGAVQPKHGHSHYLSQGKYKRISSGSTTSTIMKTPLWKGSTSSPNLSQIGSKKVSEKSTNQGKDVQGCSPDMSGTTKGQCEAVEILDKTIDCLRVADENLVSVADEEMSTKQEDSVTNASTTGSGPSPRPVNMFPNQPKNIRNFTFRSLTRSHARTSDSISGMLADQKYHKLRNYLQSRGLPKAPGPPIASRTNLLNRDSMSTYKTLLPSNLQGWSDSGSSGRNEWNEYSSIGESFNANELALFRAFGATEDDVSKLAGMFDSLSNRTESLAGTRGSNLSLNVARDIKRGSESEIKASALTRETLTLDENSNDFRVRRKNTLASQKSGRQHKTHHVVKGALTNFEALEHLKNVIKTSDDLRDRNSETQYMGRTALNAQFMKFSRKDIHTHLSTQCDQRTPQGEFKPAAGNSQRTSRIVSVFSDSKGKNYAPTYALSDFDSRKGNNKQHSFHKSHSARCNAVEKSADNKEESPSTESSRAQTALCVGTSSFEPINVRYSTKSTHTPRSTSNVMFAAGDYVGYQHRKFAKQTKEGLTVPCSDSSYDDRTKAKFLKVKIGDEANQNAADERPLNPK